MPIPENELTIIETANNEPVLQLFSGLLKLEGNPILSALAKNPEAQQALRRIDRRNLQANLPTRPMGFLAIRQTTKFR